MPFETTVFFFSTLKPMSPDGLRCSRIVMLSPGCIRPLNFNPLPPAMIVFQSACCCNSAWIISICATAGMMGKPGKCPLKQGKSAAITQLQESASPSPGCCILSKLNTGPVKLSEQVCYGLAGQFATGRVRQLFNHQYAARNLDAIKLVTQRRLQLPG
jgi:hypothetical protein